MPGILRNIVTRLGFNVDRGQLNRAENAVDSIRNRVLGVRSAAGRLGGAFRTALGTIVSTALVAQGARGLGGILVEADSLRARLETVEGSAEAGERAFSRMRQFAKGTPFQINKLTDAYIGLRVRGFEATDRSLTAFGDTAAAFSKDITDIQGAAASLLRGEADPIEQFGISAKFSGDQIRVSFGDMKRTIKRDAGEIEKFLTDVGEANFAGAMARQMDTLGGRMSNLRDAVFQFADRIGGRAEDPNSLRAALGGLLDELIGTTSGAGDLADRLGRVLARAVRGITRTFQLAKENIEPLKRAIRILVSIIAARAVIRGGFAFAGMLKAIASAGALAQIKLALLVAAVVALGLIIEDVIVFMQGGNSITGRLLGDNSGAARDFLQGLIDFGRQFYEDVLIPVGQALRQHIDTVWPQLKALGEEVFGAIKDIAAEFSIELETVGDLFAWLIGVGSKVVQLVIAAARRMVPIWRAVFITIVRLVKWLVGVIERAVAMIQKGWKKAEASGLLKVLKALLVPALTFGKIVVLVAKAFVGAFHFMKDIAEVVFGKLFDWLEKLIAMWQTAIDKTASYIKKAAEAAGINIADARNTFGSGIGGSLRETSREFRRRSELVDTSLRGGVDPAQLLRVAGGGSFGDRPNLSVGSVNATVQIDGSVDMNSDQAGARIRAAAERAFADAIEGAYLDVAEVAP